MKVGRRKECFESRVMEKEGVELSSSVEAAAGARWMMSPAAETSKDTREKPISTKTTASQERSERLTEDMVPEDLELADGRRVDESADEDRHGCSGKSE